MARPTKFSPDILDTAKELALQGKTDEEIAAALEVSRSTLALWKARHAEFSDALRSWKDEADDAIEHSLYRKALNGDTTAAIFWLKNRRKEAWRDKHEVEHSANAEWVDLLTAARERRLSDGN